MNVYFIAKTLHIINSTILFGTGIGIAFFMFRSYFVDNLHEKYYAARNTAVADYIFTLPAVFFQPLTGIWLIYEGGYGWNTNWLLLTYGIYILTGICWLPVVWIQIQLKKMVAECIESNTALPLLYHKLFKIWFLLGWPAFIGLVFIFYLMVAKPV